MTAIATGLRYLAIGLGLLTAVIGVIACPFKSVELQSAFLYLSTATIVCVLGSLVSHMFLPIPYQRMVTMGYGVVPFVAVWAFLLYTYLDYGKIREASARTQTINNGKQIGLAMHAIHDQQKRLPVDIRNAGQPTLSWRVSLCPYLDAAPIYQQFDLTQAWDSPRNRPLVEKMPYVFGSVLFPDAPGSTPWQGFVGPGTAFDPDQRGLNLGRDFPDGTSNTILVIEAQEQVPWSKPADISYGPGIPLPPLGQNYLNKGEWPFCCPVRTTPSYYACMADGTVRFISSDISESVLRAMIVRNDGQP